MYSGTITKQDLLISKLSEKVPGITKRDLVVSDDVITALPCERPWLSAMGACMIGITDVRRNVETGKIEFQLADQNKVPYENGTAWATADNFYDEYPQ
jgi:hypothetical protein